MALLIDLVTDSENEELPDVSLPSCSQTTEQENEADKSENTSSESLHKSPEKNTPPSQQETAGSKRANAAKPLDVKEIQAKRRKQENAMVQKELRTEIMNTFRPGQCMKHMVVEIHPFLTDLWFMKNVGPELAAAGARLHVMETIPNPGLIRWSRIMPLTLQSESGQVRLSEASLPCEMALYISTTLELGELIANKKLVSHIGKIRDMVDGDLTMVVYGDYKNYCRKSINPNRQHMTEERVDEAKINLLMETGVDMQFIDKQSDLALWVVQCTKALAQAPYKNAKHELSAAAANFYLKGDKKNSVAVNKDGEGLSRLWQQMISALPSSSLEIARALCGKYKTPIQLIESLEKPEGVEELSNIEVNRSGAPGAKPRRLGTELANKLRQLYTSKDPSLVLT